MDAPGSPPGSGRPDNLLSMTDQHTDGAAEGFVPILSDDDDDDDADIESIEEGLPGIDAEQRRVRQRLSSTHVIEDADGSTPCG